MIDDDVVATGICAEWRALVNALCDLAPLEEDWTTTFFQRTFRGLYERADDDIPKIKFTPNDGETWDALFGFFGTKPKVRERKHPPKNNAPVYYYHPDSIKERKTVKPLSWKRIGDIFRAIGKVGIGDFRNECKKRDPATWAVGLGIARRKVRKRQRLLERARPPQPDPLHGPPSEETEFSKILGPLPKPMVGKDFIGRDSLLDDLAAELGIEKIETSNTGVLKRAIALHGTGGIGKTQLVAQYASKWEASYTAILYIAATKPGDLAANLSSIIPGTDPDKSHEALIEWSRRSGLRLLILDNVDTRAAAQEVSDLVEALGAVHVLITTRISDWDDKHDKITAKPIGLLEETDAVTFLMNWSKRPPEETGDALELVKDLGRITSLLRYAAGHIRARAPFRIREYHELWVTKREEIAKWFDFDRAESEKKTGYPTLEEAMTWQTSFDELNKVEQAQQLFEQLCWFGSEPIPRSLVRGDLTRERALSQIKRLSLLSWDNEDSFRINNALQDTTRAALIGRNDHVSLAEAAARIGAIFASDRTGFLPHALSILHFVQDRRSHLASTADVLFALGREVVFEVVAAANEPKTFQRLPPKYLTSVLSDFYEIEPLEPILTRLVETPLLWQKNRGKFININNYVLRYALGEAIGHGWTKVDEIEELLTRAENLNEFEIAGYALNIAYDNNQDRVAKAKEFIQRLCNRPEYPGRSILGDLFLHLAFGAFTYKTLEGLANKRFWDPRWQFIELDVEMIRAIRRMKGDRVPAKGTRSCIEALKFIEKERRILLRRGLGAEVKALIRNYESLGDNPNGISRALDDLDLLEQPDLQRVMRLFFAHPIWSVAESAATNLSKLAKTTNPRSHERLEIISELLRCEGNWRITFGACEAAYAVSVIDKQLFFDSIKMYYRHESSKIRGLCAENLFAMMLTSDDGPELNRLYKEFRIPIEYWVQKENDAWVLDHVYRLFNTLDKRKISICPDGDTAAVDPDHLASVSPLLTGLEENKSWYRVSREKFLCHIERQRKYADQKKRRKSKREKAVKK